MQLGYFASPLPPQVGEVWVKGSTVFLGYYNLPQASADSFSDDGWFKTGDLGKATSSGYIHVVDRKKDMILCGGENVYCTEVRRRPARAWHHLRALSVERAVCSACGLFV